MGTRSASWVMSHRLSQPDPSITLGAWPLQGLECAPLEAQRKCTPRLRSTEAHIYKHTQRHTHIYPCTYIYGSPSKLTPAHLLTGTHLLRPTVFHTYMSSSHQGMHMGCLQHTEARSHTLIPVEAQTKCLGSHAHGQRHPHISDTRDGRVCSA